VWRADRTPNPVGFPALALVPWVEIDPVLGCGTAGNPPCANPANTTVTVSTPGLAPITLNAITAGVLAGTFFSQTAYDPTLTGDWTITATNTTGTTTDTITTTRPGFVPVAAMPFVQNIGFTGTGTNITVHWDVTPAGVARLDQQQVSIWDITNPASPVTVFFAPLGNVARQVTLTGLVLGRRYAVEINQVDINPNRFTDAFSGNWLTGWTPVANSTPVPEPATMTLLLTGLAGAGVRRLRQRRKSRES
jgi:hypothetical protein